MEYLDEAQVGDVLLYDGYIEVEGYAGETEYGVVLTGTVSSVNTGDYAYLILDDTSVISTNDEFHDMNITSWQVNSDTIKRCSLAAPPAPKETVEFF